VSRLAVRESLWQPLSGRGLGGWGREEVGEGWGEVVVRGSRGYDETGTRWDDEKGEW
jgi:hypothetical protein